MKKALLIIAVLAALFVTPASAENYPPPCPELGAQTFETVECETPPEETVPPTTTVVETTTTTEAPPETVPPTTEAPTTTTTVQSPPPCADNEPGDLDPCPFDVIVPHVPDPDPVPGTPKFTG